MIPKVKSLCLYNNKVNMTDFVKKKIVNTLIHAVQCILVHVTCYITPLKQLSMYFFFLIINNNKFIVKQCPIQGLVST